MTDEQREAAVSRIKAKRDFWGHVVTYLIVNTVLVIIWAVSTGGYFWPIWSIAGWGVGLAFHAWSVFGEERPISEERIQKEIDKGS